MLCFGSSCLGDGDGDDDEEDDDDESDEDSESEVEGADGLKQAPSVLQVKPAAHAFVELQGAQVPALQIDDRHWSVVLHGLPFSRFFAGGTMIARASSPNTGFRESRSL